MRKQTFAVIGLGLLGGSLCGALRKVLPNSNIVGISRSQSKLREALKKKLITAGTRHLQKGVASADFVFICTPVDTIPKLILQIDHFAKSGAVVTDVGSTKENLIRWVERRKFSRIHFIGSHPMAGSHLTGLNYANANLYQDAFTFVTTHRGINKRALYFVLSIWKKLCWKTFVVSAARHDRIVAEISHLPHLLATLLVGTVSRKALPYASSGFRDTTRVAQSDPRLWVPILLSNQKNILRELNQFSKLLNQIKLRLTHSDKRFLSRFLESSAFKRSQI